MNSMALVPVLLTAFYAGLLGSGHCFGMCGGIAGSLGAMGGAGGRAAALGSALLFNGGRLVGYGLLGGLAALLLGGAGEMLAVPMWGRWLRLLTALMIALIGLRYLFGWRALDWLEKAGGGVWARVSPLAARAAAMPGWTGRLVLGLCWGLLPCGLVYTLLLTAAATGAFGSGALTMLAFGAGTLPAMLGLTLASPLLSAFLADRWTRRLIGLALVLLAVWAVFLAWPVGTEGHLH